MKIDNKTIESLIKARILRTKQIDKETIKTLLSSSERIYDFIKSLVISENNSDIIFRELYEAIRQIGEARWRLLGYEPLNHEISLDGIIDLEIKNKIYLNHLQRFKKIRNDLNYRGIRVEVSQAKEIVDFWKNCGEEILEILKRSLD
jgi:hypothetical protein